MEALITLLVTLSVASDSPHGHNQEQTHDSQ
jgi:hypothetical protein